MEHGRRDHEHRLGDDNGHSDVLRHGHWAPGWHCSDPFVATIRVLGSLPAGWWIAERGSRRGDGNGAFGITGRSRLQRVECHVFHELYRPVGFPFAPNLPLTAPLPA